MDDLSPQRLREMLTVLLGRSMDDSHRVRIAELVEAIPLFVVLDTQIRHLRGRAQVVGVDTLLNQMRQAYTSREFARQGLAELDAVSELTNPTVLRAARAERAALHRELVARLSVSSAQLTDAELQLRLDALGSSPGALVTRRLATKYRNQRARVEAGDAYVASDRRFTWLLHRARLLDGLSRSRGGDAADLDTAVAPVGSDTATRLARIDEQIQDILTEITERFEPVVPTTDVPEHPLHTGVPDCALVSVNRLVEFRRRHGKLPQDWSTAVMLAHQGLAGVPEWAAAEAADADWQHFSSLRALINHVSKHGGAAAGAMVFRAGGRAGGHMFEVELDDDGHLVVHEWVGNEERIFRDGEVRGWLRERERLGILKVKALVADAEGDAVIPFVKGDRLALTDDIPAVMLAGLPNDGDPSVARDRDNRAELDRQQDLLAAQVGSSRHTELEAVEELLFAAGHHAADMRIEPVRLLEFNRGDQDGDRGRVVVQYGDPTTADTVLGIVVDTVTDGRQLMYQPDMIAGAIAAAAERGGTVAAVVVYRHDDSDAAYGRAPYDTDLDTADATALAGELEPVYRARTRKPRIEFVSRGDGAAVTEVAREQLAAEGIDTVVGDSLDTGFRVPPLPRTPGAQARGNSWPWNCGTTTTPPRHSSGWTLWCPKMCS